MQSDQDISLTAEHFMENATLQNMLSGLLGEAVSPLICLDTRCRLSLWL